ncbi:hypothetical protein [Kibdelosporangium philippinense]|uniref:hypothetical protein n=1 Tax=Kibdelosporangium philippinense TaxID=211113 RepID=UPI003610FBC5
MGTDRSPRHSKIKPSRVADVEGPCATLMAKHPANHLTYHCDHFGRRLGRAVHLPWSRVGRHTYRGRGLGGIPTVVERLGGARTLVEGWAAHGPWSRVGRHTYRGRGLGGVPILVEGMKGWAWNVWRAPGSTMTYRRER